MSRRIIWESSSVTRPTTRSRVDCGLGLVIARRCPTSRLSRVDFPALGRPATVTVPARGMPEDRKMEGGGRRKVEGGGGVRTRHERPSQEWLGRRKGCRRRPTLPRPLSRSTIGAVGLNDRVRNGNECGPYALVASVCIEIWFRQWAWVVIVFSKGAALSRRPFESKIDRANALRRLYSSPRFPREKLGE